MARGIRSTIFQEVMNTKGYDFGRFLVTLLYKVNSVGGVGLFPIYGLFNDAIARRARRPYSFLFETGENVSVSHFASN
jgi:hypothetical protein